MESWGKLGMRVEAEQGGRAALYRFGRPEFNLLCFDGSDSFHPLYARRKENRVLFSPFFSPFFSLSILILCLVAVHRQYGDAYEFPFSQMPLITPRCYC